MKKTLNYFVLSFALSVPAFAADESEQWGSVTNGIQISIRLSSGGTVINTNQPVRIIIHYKNISTNETFTITGKYNIEFNSSYVWTVLSPSGKDVSPDLFSKAVQSVTWDKLKPLESMEAEYNLSVRCNFSEIGTYRITLNKGMGSDTSQKLFVVVSNPLNVTITSGK